MNRRKCGIANLESDDPRVADTVECILIFVFASGVLDGADVFTIVHAISVIHGELMAMMEGGDAYRDALKRVADGSEHPASLLALLIATSTRKIDILREVGIELTPEDMRDIRRELGLSTDEMAMALRLGRNGGRTVRGYEAGTLAPSGPVTLLYEGYEDGRLRPNHATSRLHYWRPPRGPAKAG